MLSSLVVVLIDAVVMITNAIRLVIAQPQEGDVIHQTVSYFCGGLSKSL